MTLDDVARVTKIQPKILERLEAGKTEGLPADVFVRGFVRSVARCVGLDEDEALRRYGACADAKAVGPAARAVVEAMADLAPRVARGSLAPEASTVEEDEADVELAAGSDPELVPPDVEIPIHVDAEPTIASEPVLEPVLEPASIEVAPELAAEVAAATEPTPAPAPAPIAESFESVTLVIAPPADVDLTAIEAPIVAAVAATEPAPTKKKRARRNSNASAGGKSRKRKAMAIGTPAEATPVVAQAAAELPLADAPVEAPAAEPAPVATPVVEPAITPATELAADEVTLAAAPIVEPASEPVEVDASAEASAEASADDTIFAPDHEPTIATAVDPGELEADAFASGTWMPKMPPPSTTSVPWRRPYTTAAAPVPSLVAVIDDADPESAERALEERRTKEPRRSFLPPILLDREDRSARQGGLTLAVIILLIAATLTLSYLMRRPSSTGAGMTRNDAPVTDVVA